jgi:eukaryotic-like serine/threonine-protein kinase
MSVSEIRTHVMMSDFIEELEIEWRIDRIADRFEAAFRAGRAPDIEGLLSEVPEAWQATLFRELLAVEVQLRQDRGEQPQREEYERRFPGRGQDIEVAFHMADDNQDSTQTLRVANGSTSLPMPPSRDRQEDGEAASAGELPSAAASGTRFGRFELVERLGSGGFGTVWKAYDTVLKRSVALKIPHPDQFCPRSTLVLMQEARSVASLKHAGLALVYDVGEEAGTPYIAREYIHGSSLRDQLRLERLSCRRAAEICLDVAAALHHAHERGIVHSDLKPGNILLDELGTAYVTDFGLAQVKEQGTRSDQRLGTLCYMAPEQAAEPIREIDRRTDVYALGVVLYEMLAGQRPFQASGDALLKAIETCEPARPRKTHRRIPRDLEAICLRCLNKAPGDRYQTAAELADDLRKFLQGEPVGARPLSVPMRLERWARRRPAIAALALTSLMLLIAVLGVGAVSYVHTTEALATAQLQLYFRCVLAANQAWLGNDMREVDRLLDQCPPRLRHWEWGHLDALRHSAMFVLPNAGGPVAFSPDGKLIATGGGSDPSLKFWDATTGARLDRLISHTGHLSSVEFSSDGKYLVSAGGADGTAIVWDVATRRKIVVFPAHTGRIHSARFFPDGKRFATVGTDGLLCIWHVGSQQLEQCFHYSGSTVRSLAVSSDGRHVALATGSGDRARIRVWDLDSDDPEGSVWNVPAFQRASGLAFSPDGQRLAVAAGRQLIRIWDVASRTMIQAYPLIPVAAPQIICSPDGTRIAAISWDNSVEVCDTAAGRTLMVFRGHEGRIQDIAFSPDGQLLAFGTNANRVYVHRTSGEQGTLTLRGHAGTIAGLAFVPGSTRLVSAGADGTVRLWDVAQRRELRLLAKQASPVNRVCCSPDGRAIAAVTADGMIRIWNADSGELSLEIRGHAGPVHDVTYDPSGTVLAVAHGTKTVALWDARTGQPLDSFDGSCESIHRIAFSPCGQWLAVGGRDRQVQIFEAHTLRRTRKFTLGSAVCGIAFGRNGRLAVVAADASTRCWNVDTGEVLWTLPPTSVRRQADLAFHPDGTRLVLAIGGEAVTLWDLQHNQRLFALRQKSDVGGLVTFSPEGTYIAAATGDGSVCVWSSSTPSLEDAVGRKRRASAKE